MLMIFGAIIAEDILPYIYGHAEPPPRRAAGRHDFKHALFLALSRFNL